MNLEYYKNKFGSLSVKITSGVKAPNKAILLLSVIDLIRCNYIVDNKILLDDTIEASFGRIWTMYVGSSIPTVWTPFWHLHSEAFWHFEPVVNNEAILSLVPNGQTASIGKMRSNIKYAYLDKDLFDYIKDKKSRDVLVDVLKKNYL